MFISAHTPLTTYKRLGFILAILVATVFISIGLATPASAAIKYSELSPRDQAKALDYSLLMRQCFGDGGMHVHTGRDEVNRGNIFNTAGSNSNGDKNARFSGFSLGSNFRVKSCRDLNSNIPSILKFFDITGTQLYCAMGYVSQGNCLQGSGNFTEPDSIKRTNAPARAEAFRGALKQLIGLDSSSPGSPALYWWWRESLAMTCGAKSLTKSEFNNSESAYRYTLKEYNTSTGQLEDSYFLSNEPMSHAFNLNKYMTPSDTERTCQYKVSAVNKNSEALRVSSAADAAKKYCESKGLFTSTGSSSVTALANACINGAINKDNRSYCSQNYGSDENQFKACREAQDADLANFTTPDRVTDTEESDTESNCSIENIGWIVCPVVNFMAKVSDQSFNFLSDNFLKTDISILSTDNATYKAWSQIRNVANVLFIIAFLFIVYSQLTGMGIGNYGIKKMLPRIIVSAILVNLSFLICQLAVDLSNILGVSINDFLKSLTPASSGGVGSDGGTTFGAITASILGITAGAAVAYTFIAALIPILVGAVVALIMILFILLARQALIVLLIVLAPLAFVAFLLPNTEKWFSSWRKMFVALLMVFPIISVVYGASSLASGVLSESFGSTDLDITGSDLSAENASGMWGQIIAAAVAILPLFIVPGLLKKSIDGAGSIGGKINQLGNKASGSARARTANSGVMKSIGDRRRRTRAQVGAGIYSGRGGKLNPSNWRSRMNSGLNKSGAFNTLTGDYGTRRGAQIAGLEAEESKLAESALILASRGENGISVDDQFSTAIRSGDLVKAKAAQNLLMSRGGPGVDSVVKALSSNTGSANVRRALAENIMENHAVTAKQKNVPLLNWAMSSGAGDISSIAKDKNTWSNLSANELASQTDSAFASAISSQGVSPTAIKSFTEDSTIYGSLSNKKKETLSKLTSTGAATGGAAKTQGPQPPIASTPVAPSVPVTTSSFGSSSNPTATNRGDFAAYSPNEVPPLSPTRTPVAETMQQLDANRSKPVDPSELRVSDPAAPVDIPIRQNPTNDPTDPTNLNIPRL